MIEQNFENFLDLGSSKLRLGVFDKKLFKLKYISEKNCITNLSLKKLDINNSQSIISELVREAEKNINSHIKDLNLIIDTTNITTIAISLKKNFDEKLIDKEDINYFIIEAQRLIKSNHPDKKILHTIIDKYIFDNIEYDTFPEKNNLGKKIVLQLKFICIPKLIFEEIISKFKENLIQIKKIYISSYVKSFNYSKFFERYNYKTFIDIGYNKSCLTIFKKKKLFLIKNIPIGGNHITKDISKILEIPYEEAEEVKRSLNQSNSTFSYKSNEEFLSNNEIKKDLENKFSLKLLNQVIYARIEEILKLCVDHIKILNLKDFSSGNVLIFTGEGSKILNKNSIYLKDEFNSFEDIHFYNESKESICESACNFERYSNLELLTFYAKKPDKKGFFERFFQFFE